MDKTIVIPVISGVVTLLASILITTLKNRSELRKIQTELEQKSILLPPHPNCKIGDKDIIATFHTHPNIGNDYLQEPSETDKRAVRDDPDLKGEFYEGEFVISQEKVYLISPNGQVYEDGDSWEILI